MQKSRDSNVKFANSSFQFNKFYHALITPTCDNILYWPYKFRKVNFLELFSFLKTMIPKSWLAGKRIV